MTIAELIIVVPRLNETMLMYNLRMSMYVTGPNGFSLRDLAAFIYGWKNILYKNKVMTILECLKIDFNFILVSKVPDVGNPN